MAHVDMFFRLVFAALAFCVVAIATGKLALRAADEVAPVSTRGWRSSTVRGADVLDDSASARRRGRHQCDVDPHQRLDSRVARRCDFLRRVSHREGR